MTESTVSTPAEPTESVEPVLDTPEAQEADTSVPDVQPEEDVERLLPSPGEPFELVNGTRVIAQELKLREWLKILKVVTRGASMAMGNVSLDVSDPNFGQNLISMLLFAVPEAEDEVVEMLQSLVRPAGPFPGTSVKEKKESEQEAFRELWTELDNPEPEDVVTIIEVIVHNESQDLRRLGKRLGSAMAFAQKTGQA